METVLILMNLQVLRGKIKQTAEKLRNIAVFFDVNSFCSLTEVIKETNELSKDLGRSFRELPVISEDDIDKVLQAISHLENIIGWVDHEVDIKYTSIMN